MIVIPALPLVLVIASFVPQRTWQLVAIFLASPPGPAPPTSCACRPVPSAPATTSTPRRWPAERSLRVILVEIMPNLLPLLTAQFLFALIFAILGEAGLSYLGLGPTDSITWGTILNDAQSGQALGRGAWWWFVPPGIMIAILGRRPRTDQHSRSTRSSTRNCARARRRAPCAQGREDQGGHRMSQPVLTARNVSIEYEVDPPVKAVRDVSLTLNRGEILGSRGRVRLRQDDPGLWDEPPPQGAGADDGGGDRLP